jgi:hypothetical protein
MAAILAPRASMSLLLAAVTLVMTVLARRCAMVRSRSRTLSCYRGLLQLVEEITPGRNGLGKGDHLSSLTRVQFKSCYRVFRTDYGHTEVAAHFGNGKSFPCCIILDLNYGTLDPREYCISTKDFTVDQEGKLAGMNTSKFCLPPLRLVIDEGLYLRSSR